MISRLAQVSESQHVESCLHFGWDILASSYKLGNSPIEPNLCKISVFLSITRRDDRHHAHAFYASVTVTIAPTIVNRILWSRSDQSQNRPIKTKLTLLILNDLLSLLSQ